MIITDAQVHIWECSRPGREWPRGRYVPSWAYKPLSADMLIDKMDNAGVARAVLVPPSFEGDRNELSLAAAARYPERFAVMGRIALDDPASKERVLEWPRIRGAIGLRLTFFIPQQKAWLSDGTADWLWPAAEGAQIPLMVLPDPSLLPAIACIAARHPHLRLIVDHLGVGHEAWNRDARAFAHLDELIKLAVYPNVAVKASGLPEYSGQGYPYQNLHPYIERVIREFGIRRVFWGSDLTRLPCTYRQSVTMFTEELPSLSECDKEWVMGRALSEWLSWPTTDAT